MIEKTILWRVGEVSKNGTVLTEESLRGAADKLPGGTFDEVSKCLMFEGHIAPVTQDGKIMSADIVAESAVSMGDGDQMLNKVVKLIADKFGIKLGEIKLSDKLGQDIGDSLDKVELIMQLEDKFNIEIPDEDMDDLTTVYKLVEYLKERS